MKYPIRVLLSLVTLCTIGLGTDNVSAESNRCGQIRAVRRLAIRENLDSDNLATLEYKYCGHSNRRSSSIQSPRNSSQNCFDLTVMAQLARITQERRRLVRMVEGLQEVTCERPRQGRRSSLNWQNGQTAKLGSNWYYPNGQTAKLGSSWYYPNGQTAKFGSAWNYPNGQTAKLGSIWHNPRGRATSADRLLKRACRIVGTTECDRILTDINRSDRNRSDRNRSDRNRSDRNRRNDFWRDLAIIQISWQAYQSR
ncbi:hypothetical protein [Moorena sp. SIOASIH]|uniref:hypothetical protein n=1 Tax=Moorena sp. SIOASIH TaxID=2607817 RepID=UPI0025F224EF|nr:hypothetical protein [Moorena sp. SIOASIH]